MVHGWTRKGTSLYRYYVCNRAHKRGWETCPTKSVPAIQIEEFVVNQIRVIGRDAEVRRATFAQALAQVATQRQSLAKEAKRLSKDAARSQAEVKRLVAAVSKASGSANEALLGGLANAQDHLSTSERRLTEIQQQEAGLGALQVNEDDLGQTLERFEPIWDVLLTPEKERILRLLIEQIGYDGATEMLSFAFRLQGIASLTAATTERAS